MAGQHFFKKLIDKVSTSKKSIVLFFIAFLFILLIPKTSQAVLQFFVGPVISAVTSAVLLVIWGVTSLLPQAMGAFFDLVLNLNMSYTNEQFIYIGWKVVKDLTNLFFVVALIAIGLATSLGIGDYHAKKTLPKLIGIAILINFSLVISGFILDATSIVMNYFLAEIGGIGTLFHAQAQLLFSGSWADSLISSFTFEAPIKLALAIAINLLMAMTLFLFAMLFLIRYAVLWFLVIISPFAFFCFILPSTQKYWSQWWGTFFQWAFIGIPAGFTLYISMQLMSSFNTGIAVVTEGNALGDWFPNIDRIVPLVLVCVFSIIGLFYTISSNAAGVQKMVGFSKKRVLSGAKTAKGMLATSKIGNMAINKTAGFNKAISAAFTPDQNDSTGKKYFKRAMGAGLQAPGAWLETRGRMFQQQGEADRRKKSEEYAKAWHNDKETAAAAVGTSLVEPGAVGSVLLPDTMAKVIASGNIPGAMGLIKERYPEFYKKGVGELSNNPALKDDLKVMARHNPDILENPDLQDATARALIPEGLENEEVKRLMKPYGEGGLGKSAQQAMVEAATAKVFKDLKDGDIEHLKKNTGFQDSDNLKRILAENKSPQFLRKMEGEMPGYFRKTQDAIMRAAEINEKYWQIILKKNPGTIYSTFTPNASSYTKSWGKDNSGEERGKKFFEKEEEKIQKP